MFNMYVYKYIPCPIFTSCTQKMDIIKFFSISTSKLKSASPEILKTKGKKASSQQWLARHLSDPYVEKAKRMNYRCRSAFKLLEINERFNILQPGNVVLDIGAAPGSWTQVLVEKVHSKNTDQKSPTGIVIAVDKSQIYPIEGATILGNMDFTQSNVQDTILNLLDGRKVDAVLSDMAPNATGVHAMDNENIVKLCYSVLRFALPVSKPNATLLVKAWQCEEFKKFESNMARFYEKVRVVKPNSSRSDSAEVFLLGRNFKGIE
ncbi:mitochondrial rRNA methyltransferase 2 [Leptinotarsa decemlineata]|uniref:mitochondrial rRNA methyltransferase 2 n=1 Tax=Leptinotarsa decemlineata TaxID=7539 RepID=UPI003D306658